MTRIYPDVALIPPDIHTLYEVYQWRTAAAVLKTAHPEQWDDVMGLLRTFRINYSEVVAGGGGETSISKRFNGALRDKNWIEKPFNIRTEIDGTEVIRDTHIVDCYKDRVALETEWNNKDTFYDRDLSAFRELYDNNVIDVGIIVTRDDSLNPLFKELDIYRKYGATTTHVGKLLPKLRNRGSGGCPVLVFGIKPDIFINDPLQP